MNWRPKDWRWPPRLAKGFAKGFDLLRRTVPRALATARKALRNVDRRTFPRIWARLRVYAKSYYFITLIVLAVLTAPLWFDLLLTVRANLIDLLDRGPATDKDGALDVRGHYFAIGILVTALAALFTAPLALLKAYINERQTNTAEQGLITDRFTRAVEQLGAEKTVKYLSRTVTYIPDAGQPDRRLKTTLREGHEPDLPDGAVDIQASDWETLDETVPNLEVRLGAIYALERIAQDSERDHIPIMETLCAYIRENAPAAGAKDDALGDWPDWPDDADDQARAERAAKLARHNTKLRNWAAGLPAPRVDVQAALSIIGRRGEERIAHERRQRKGDRGGGPGFHLDLRDTNLQHADLTHAQLDNALLEGARLEGAKLWRARLERANLREARLDGANTCGARLEGTFFHPPT